jgi:hypothetical protein
MKFSISILYHALAFGETLCYVYLPEPPSGDEIRRMIGVLEGVLSTLPGPIDVCDTLNDLARVLPGEIELFPGCGKSFGMGQKDVTFVFGRDAEDCVFYLDPESNLEDLERFLS